VTRRVLGRLPADLGYEPIAGSDECVMPATPAVGGRWPKGAAEADELGHRLQGSGRGEHNPAGLVSLHSLLQVGKQDGWPLDEHATSSIR
jgi:hypothetical protein